MCVQCLQTWKTPVVGKKCKNSDFKTLKMTNNTKGTTVASCADIITDDLIYCLNKSLLSGSIYPKYIGKPHQLGIYWYQHNP